MRITLITLTKDRLFYTRECFKILKEKAGYPYKHFIVDNGSTDGTYRWLKDNNYRVISNKRNMGVTFGLKQAADLIKKCDLVVKFDNDCEVITDNILKKLASFCKRHKNRVVSPKIHGINHPPKGVMSGEWEKLDMVGGIFRAMPYKIFMDMAEMEILCDSKQAEYFRKNNIEAGYLLSIEANHYETTNGQKERLGDEYHKNYIF